MKTRLKYFFIWLLILVFGYNLGGYVIVFEISDSLNREIMHELLSRSDNDQLTVLKITNPSSLLRKGNDEIIYEGKHYDVKREVVKSGFTYFYCIHDNDEEQHYSSLNSSVNNNCTPQNEKQNASHFDFQKHLVKDYFPHSTAINFNQNPLTKTIFHCNESFHSSTFFNIITPPPKSVVA